MKYTGAIFIVIAVFSLVSADLNDNLPNLQQPRFEIYTAGQPTREGLRHISQLGVKTIINVLPEKECWKEEKQEVEALNMTYRTLPFDTKDFNLDTVQQFADLLKKEPRPILVHCSTGNHAGGLWFAYRVLMERAPLAVALKEARKIGMKPELEDAIFPWVIQQSTLTS